MIYYLLGTTLFCLLDTFTNFLCERRYSRKCGYVCNKCKNWRCSYHYCRRKRLNMSLKEYQIFLSHCDDKDFQYPEG